MVTPAQLGLLLRYQKYREEAGEQHRISFLCRSKKGNFLEPERKDWDTFSQVLRSSRQFLDTLSSGCRSVAGGTGLVEQVHRTLEA